MEAPHHTKAIMRAFQGCLDIERTVDWDRMPAVVALSLRGRREGERGERERETLKKENKGLFEPLRASPVLS